MFHNLSLQNTQKIVFWRAPLALASIITDGRLTKSNENLIALTRTIMIHW